MWLVTPYMGRYTQPCFWRRFVGIRAFVHVCLRAYRLCTCRRADVHTFIRAYVLTFPYVYSRNNTMCWPWTMCYPCASVICMPIGDSLHVYAVLVLVLFTRVMCTSLQYIVLYSKQRMCFCSITLIAPLKRLFARIWRTPHDSIPRDNAPSLATLWRVSYWKLGSLPKC